jgi:hypothetical protein
MTCCNLLAGAERKADYFMPHRTKGELPFSTVGPQTRGGQQILVNFMIFLFYHSWKEHYYTLSSAIVIPLLYI